MSCHDQALPVDNHGPYRVTFANDAARTGDAGTYTPQDVSSRVKALQLDTLDEYVLTGEGPTVWTVLPSGGGGGGTVKFACCPFGAKSDDTGKFLIANGKSSDGDDGTKPKTRQPIGLTGKLTRLAYKTKDGDTSTQMKVHVNGSVEATVILSSMNANDGGVETIDVDVVAGDYVEIEYDAAQKPGECTMYFIMEPS